MHFSHLQLRGAVALFSHALAAAQSRFMVMGETFSTSAVSASDSPQK